jgi:hypothetical protein
MNFPKVSQICITGKEENLYQIIEVRFAVLVDVVLPIRLSWKIPQGRCAKYLRTERLAASADMRTARNIW